MKMFRVEFTIVRIVEAENKKDAIQQAWFEVHDDSDSSNPASRSSSQVKEVEVSEEEYERYCNGEAIPQCPLALNDHAGSGV